MKGAVASGLWACPLIDAFKAGGRRIVASGKELYTKAEDIK